MDEPDLTVPHPRMWERRFVVAPAGRPGARPGHGIPAHGLWWRGRPVWVRCRGTSRIVCRRTAPLRGWNAEGGQMDSIRIIGPGRAGTLPGRRAHGAGLGLRRFPRPPDDPWPMPRTASTSSWSPPPTTPWPRWRRRWRPSTTTTVVHLSGSLGLDALAPHPRRAAAAPAGAAAQRRGRGGPPGSGVTFAVAGAPVGAGHGGQPRGAGGRGGRRRPCRVPRGRLHRRQPRGGPAGPGRAGGRLGRPRPGVLPAPGPGRGRRRGRAGRRGRADRPGPSGRLGHAEPPPRRAARGRAGWLPGRCRPGHPAGRHDRAAAV